MKKAIFIAFVVLIGLTIGISTSLILIKTADKVISTDFKFGILSAVVIFAMTFYYIFFKNNDILSPFYFFSMSFLLLFGLSIYSDIYLSDKYFNIIFICYLFLALGMFIGELISLFVFKKIPIQKEWSLSKVYRGGIAAFILTLPLFLIYISRYGIAIMSSNVDKARTLAIYGEVNGYFNSLSTYFFYPVSIVFFSFILKKETPNSKKGVMGLLIVLCIALLFSTGVRSGISMILMSCLFIYHYQKKNITLSKLVFTGAIFLISISAMQLIRINGQFSINEIFNRIFTEIKVVGYNLSLVLDYYSPADFLGFNALFMGFSVLLPGRQLDISMYLKEYMNYTFSGGGITPSIIGGFYMGFGTYGVYWGMFFFGLLCCLFYRYCISCKDTYHVVLYAAVITYSILSIRNGALYGAVSFSYILLLIIINRFFRESPQIQ